LIFGGQLAHVTTVTTAMDINENENTELDESAARMSSAFVEMDSTTKHSDCLQRNRESLIKFVKAAATKDAKGELSPRHNASESLPFREIRLIASLSIPSSPLESPRSDPASLSPRLQVRPYLIGGDIMGCIHEKLSARIIAERAGCKPPSFVELDAETDLNIPPPGWLTSQNQTAKTSSGDLALDLVDRASSHLTGALADLRISAQDEPADFIASSTTMKTIFSLPFSNTNVTVAVHRVDNSLILQGLINGELDAEAEIKTSNSFSSTTRKSSKEMTSGKKKRKDPDVMAMYNRFMYYSVSGEGGSEPIVESEVGEGLVREERREQAGDDSSQVFRRAIHFQFHHLGCAFAHRVRRLHEALWP
jgi:hypothetical protein